MQKLYTSAKVVVWMNRLKELRASKGMRQADLSKLLNVQPTTVSNYELGVREMDAPTILRLCEIFGCSADYLLGRSPVPSPELDPQEEAMLLAWRRATPEIRAIVETALSPYREDARGSSTA